MVWIQIVECLTKSNFRHYRVFWIVNRDYDIVEIAAGTDLSWALPLSIRYRWSRAMPGEFK